MSTYLLRRFAQAIVVLVIVTFVVVALVNIVPGGPVAALLGARRTPQELAHFNKLYGFDRPVYVQWWKWTWQLLHGNLGYSPKQNVSVASEVGLYLPKTVVLLALGIALSLIIGIPVGMYQAIHRNTVSDYTITALAFLGYSTPIFFIGLILIDVFATRLDLLPFEAPQGTTVGQVLSQPAALVLPVVSYAFVGFALWSRYMRSAVMDNLVQDYVRAARAKGASMRRVLWVHVFRNSLITIVTLLGLSLPVLIGGAVFIEVVFNYPGMGLSFYNAALNDDFATLLGYTVITTIAVVLGNLLADVGYALLDPRVRYK